MYKFVKVLYLIHLIILIQCLSHKEHKLSAKIFNSLGFFLVGKVLIHLHLETLVAIFVCA